MPRTFSQRRGGRLVEVGAGQGGVTVEVAGTEGRATLAYIPEVGDLASPPERVYVIRDSQVVQSSHMQGREMFTASFYDHVAERFRSGDDPDIHSGRHGRHLLELIFAAYESGARREVVWLSPDGAGGNDPATGR